MGKRVVIVVSLVALVLLTGPVGLAGKGGDKGKPGGGGGGGGASGLPPVELLFLAHPEGGNSSGGDDHLYVGAADQSSLREIPLDPQASYELALDPRGDVAFTNSLEGGEFVTDIESGMTIASPIGLAFSSFPLWSRRHASGAMRPYLAQRQLRGLSVDSGEIDIRVDETVFVENLVLRAMNGDEDWRLTWNEDLTSYDPDTKLFDRQDSHAVAYIPEQAELPGVAWAVYRHHTRRYRYQASSNTWAEVIDFWETRIKSLDVSGWDGVGVVEIDDRALANGSLSETASWPARISSNGRWMVFHENESAFLVPIDYSDVDSAGVPDFPFPTTAVQVDTPSGWHVRVEIAAVNDDASLVALRLYEPRKTRGVERVLTHLFVARAGETDPSDLTELTQIDIGTDGVEFDYVWGGGSNFERVVFRP